MSKKWIWFEEYECGCVSDYVDRKCDLVGYCGVHGNDRRHAYKVPKKTVQETEKENKG